MQKCPHQCAAFDLRTLEVVSLHFLHLTMKYLYQADKLHLLSLTFSLRLLLLVQESLLNQLADLILQQALITGCTDRRLVLKA